MNTKDSLKQFNKRLIAMMMPPQHRSRLPSFKKYLTKSLQTSPNRQRQFSPKPPKPPIDDYLIEKIQDLAPSKISRQFRKTQSKSMRMKTEQISTFHQEVSKCEPLIQKYRKKSLEIAKRSLNTQYNIRKKAIKPKRKQIGFGVRNVDWIQTKWGGVDKRGKFSQKLHPICIVYEDCVQKMKKNTKVLPNPFEDFIQFPQ